MIQAEGGRRIPGEGWWWEWVEHQRAPCNQSLVVTFTVTGLFCFYLTFCLIKDALMKTPASRVHVLWLQRANSHGLQKSCREKGHTATLSVKERASTLAWTGFYCFSGHITLRMVLIYYAQVLFRWLPFTDYVTKERMLLITPKKKDIFKCKGKSGGTGYTCPWEV